MAKLSRARSLTLWANGIQVGCWHVSRRGEDVLQYDPEWLASPQGRALSLSLPFTTDNQPLRGSVVRNYFDNLLPDSDAIRRRLQSRFRTLNTEAFDLLEAIGRDCVGAIQILPDGEVPQDIFQIQAQPLSEHDLANILRATSSTPGVLGQHDVLAQDFRISIARCNTHHAYLQIATGTGRWASGRHEHLCGK